jgi:negative regulator of genetic competence, sporulation and motility
MNMKIYFPDYILCYVIKIKDFEDVIKVSDQLFFTNQKEYCPGH